MKEWTGRALLRVLKGLGCKQVRQRGSHVRVQCGPCATTVPVHPGKTLPPGTLRQIERDLQPCLGKGWLR
jgi:predicted RNA binding protein YcfA (HicA-like mRNA interferase family)